MSLAPIFSLILKGNLSSNKLVLQYPIQKFQKGVWQIAIDSIAYDVQIQPNVDKPHYFCSVKCNWITAINYNENNELVSESPSIFQFFISKPQDFILNNKTWFEINSLSEFLICEIIDLTSNSPLTINCSVYILIFLQRKF